MASYAHYLWNKLGNAMTKGGGTKRIKRLQRHYIVVRKRQSIRARAHYLIRLNTCNLAF